MWVAQSFLHELSAATGRDHVEFLVEWLSRSPSKAQGQEGRPGQTPDGSQVFNSDRAMGVVKLAAEKVGWGKKVPPAAPWALHSAILTQAMLLMPWN